MFRKWTARVFKQSGARKRARRKNREYGQIEWEMGRTSNALSIWADSDMKPTELEERASAMFEALRLVNDYYYRRSTFVSRRPRSSDETFLEHQAALNRSLEDLQQDLRRITGLPNGMITGRTSPVSDDYLGLFREFMKLAARA